MLRFIVGVYWERICIEHLLAIVDFDASTGPRGTTLFVVSFICNHN